MKESGIEIYKIKPNTVTITMTGQEKLPKWKEKVCKWLKIVPERVKHYKAELYFTGRPELGKMNMLYDPHSLTKWIVTNIIGNRADIVIIQPNTENIKHISEFIYMGSVLSEF
jgi:hypothetical protein